MGFGFLFVGYFMTFLMSNLHAGIGFAGAYLMALGLWRLKDYKRRFIYALYPLAVLMALALKDTVTDLLSVFGETPAFFELAAVKTAFDFLEIAAVLIFVILLFLAIAELAESVSLEKLRISSLRNIYFFGAYTLFCAVRYLPLAYPREFLKYFNLVIALMQLFWIAVSMITLFSCFRNIADKEKLDKQIEKELKEDEKKKAGEK